MVYLSTIMLPAQVTLIPLYIVFRQFGWVGTILPLVVPAFFGNALYVFLLRQFFMTIPNELTDAARIDGASELGIFSRIMLPLPAGAGDCGPYLRRHLSRLPRPAHLSTDQSQWTIRWACRCSRICTAQWQLMTRPLSP